PVFAGWRRVVASLHVMQPARERAGSIFGLRGAAFWEGAFERFESELHGLKVARAGVVSLRGTVFRADVDSRQRQDRGFEGLAANNPSHRFVQSSGGPMEYRCETRSVAGFVQQLAVAYVGRGYFFYVTGEIPERKDPCGVDAKLIAKYGLAIGKTGRAR